MSIKMLLVQEIENGQVKTIHYGPSQVGGFTSTTTNDAAKRSAAMKKAWRTRKAAEAKK